MGPSLKATNMMVNISADFPHLFTFLMILMAFIGFCGAIAVFSFLARIHITQTLSPDKFSWGVAIPALLVCGALGGFSTTMFLVSGTALDSGAGSLFPPTAITGGVSPKQMVGMFAEQTARLIGWCFGGWGLCEMLVSRMPDRDRTLWSSGVIRLFVGALLISARDFGNLFGGMGDVFFQ